MLGRPYDQSTVVFDKGLQNKDDLDAVAPNVPVYLVHVSGHLAVANGAVLKAAGIDRNALAPGLVVLQREE